jgi:hypothetical protein
MFIHDDKMSLEFGVNLNFKRFRSAAKVRNHIPKRVPECLMLRNHRIIVIIFSSFDFKKRLSRRDMDERFHLSTTQDKVKISIKSSMR